MSKLYVVPNTINDTSKNMLPEYITQEIKHVRLFFVEEPKSARRLLKNIMDSRFRGNDMGWSLNDCQFFELNEHSHQKDIQEYTNLLKQQDGAIISEAGCPCVADPGSDLVFLAHQNNIEIVPLVGPSSILLALMASGLNGQNFAFNGYLPKDAQGRLKKIKLLEDRSFKEGQTQIFMETPYRNLALLKDVLSICHEKTLVCVACDLASDKQYIKTKSAKEWKNQSPDLDKKPTLFLLQKR